MDNNEFFRVSSGLKSLIGAELITDIYVAIFELVKNAFDAKAKEVIVTFENLYKKDNSASIIIQDNGKGMDYEDLKNKWLFVAYSAKKDGTEDVRIEEDDDYRHKLKPQRYYAGAKGVGRFSCDRLGRFLDLITIKDIPNAKVENLQIDWNDFDKNSKDDFINIPVKHQTLQPDACKINHGTILTISGLSFDEDNSDEIWTRKSLLILKDRLSKLIRPDLNRGKESQQDFKIILNVPEEIEFDSQIRKGLIEDESGAIYRETVNGEIKNFVFDDLNIKTTKISSIISNDGSFVTTNLEDRGQLIYKITEKNPFTELKDISINLYFLNRSAKVTFSRKMGLDTVKYGNIFVYKNGFRIYPYGERGDDSFRIDNRGMQGYNRFISLRNLIGQIDIQGNAENLYEATSRNGGLVKSKAFYELTDTRPYADSLLLSTLKKLEKYVVDVTDWGINNDEFDVVKDDKCKENIVRMLANTIDSESVINVEYNPDIIDIVNQKEENSVRKLVANLKRISQETDDVRLFNDAREIENKLNLALKGTEQALKEKVIAIKERDVALADKEKKNRELKLKQTENLFLKSDVGADKESLISLQHHISHTSNRIAELTNLAIEAIQEKVSENKVIDYLNKIIFENRKIATLSGIVSKANFDTKIKKIDKDIVEFVNEYVQNIYNSSSFISQRQNHVTVIVKNQVSPFIIRFIPIEIIIIIDNLLNNSEKANANNVTLEWKAVNHEVLQLSYMDNGKGILDEDLPNIFDYRFTTTNGGGLGLYHIKNIVTKSKWNIEVNNKINTGVEFLITFKK